MHLQNKIKNLTTFVFPKRWLWSHFTNLFGYYCQEDTDTCHFLSSFLGKIKWVFSAWRWTNSNCCFKKIIYCLICSNKYLCYLKLFSKFHFALLIFLMSSFSVLLFFVFKPKFFLSLSLSLLHSYINSFE